MSDTEEHHLLHVMRAGDGDKVGVFDGQGNSADALVSLNSSGHAELKLIDNTINNQTDSILLTLLLAIPKGKRMELIIE